MRFAHPGAPADTRQRRPTARPPGRQGESNQEGRRAPPLAIPVTFLAPRRQSVPERKKNVGLLKGSQLPLEGSQALSTGFSATTLASVAPAPSTTIWGPCLLGQGMQGTWLAWSTFSKSPASRIMRARMPRKLRQDVGRWTIKVAKCLVRARSDNAGNDVRCRPKETTTRP